MVKGKIANFIGFIGIILGIGAGATVVHAELYLNPMSYYESYSGLVFYFYFFFAIITTPFLMLRSFIIGKFKLRLCILFLFIASFLIFLYGQEWEKTSVLIAIGLIFPVLMGDLFFKLALEK
ncbi:MAG: hypothetical protein JNN09_05315 [Alphaproteobacteria bacterium]|nr:hypothetical protein [Alphaproteobacteria bacterium]